MDDSFDMILLMFILGRELLYNYQIHRLINKIMSRNYHDYEFTKNVSKTMKPDGHVNVKEDPELNEDLSTLNGFGIN